MLQSRTKVLNWTIAIFSFLFCFSAQTFLYKNCFLAIQRRINTLKSHYCAIVPWWILCLHIVIMDSINCSQNCHFSFLFLHIFHIPSLMSPSPVQWMCFIAVEQCVFSRMLCRVRAICKESMLLFGSRALSVGFNVNLLKILLAGIGHCLTHNSGVYLLFPLTTKCPIIANWWQ